MINFLRLPVVISAVLISSLSFFSKAVIAQQHSGCFMVNSSGQTINLGNICPTQKTVCQGPFDTDGFPLILYNQLERLNVAIKKAEQTNSRDLNAEKINFDSNMYETQSAIDTLLNQSYFSPKTRELQQELKRLYAQTDQITNSKEAAKHLEKMRATIAELKTDSCYAQIIQALEKKFPQRSFP